MMLSIFKALPSYLTGIALVIAADIQSGNQISLWVPLLFPVGFATWNHGRKTGIVVASLALLALWLEAQRFGSPFSNEIYLMIALLSKAAVFIAFVVLLDKLRVREVTRVYVHSSDNRTE